MAKQVYLTDLKHEENSRLPATLFLN